VYQSIYLSHNTALTDTKYNYEGWTKKDRDKAVTPVSQHSSQRTGQNLNTILGYMMVITEIQIRYKSNVLPVSEALWIGV
jgi:hypothetical protein